MHTNRRPTIGRPLRSSVEPALRVSTDSATHLTIPRSHRPIVPRRVIGAFGSMEKATSVDSASATNRRGPSPTTSAVSARSSVSDSTGTSFLGQIKKSLVVLFTLALGAIAMVGTTTAVAFFSSVPFIGVVVPLLLVVGLCGVFFPMYYLFPDIDLAPREVLPGTVVGAVGWVILQVLFQVYVSLSGGGGSLIASILLLVTWLYFTGVILLLGAVVNAVGLAPADVTAAEWEESSVLNTEMTRGEIATYLRGLHEDLTGGFEGMEPTSDEAAVERNPPIGTISITEWARKTETGTTHEVRLEWDADSNSED